MIARLAWIAALVLVALATTALQFDRQSRYQPSLAMLVPEPFSAFAAPHRTAAALNGGQADQGKALALQLVERRPMPALHLRLLSQAQFAANDPQAGALSVQYAARRGWRDEATQEVMLRLALDAGDRPEATRRFAALFIAPQAEREKLRALSDRVFANPGAAEAEAVFAGILAGAERWQSRYLQRGVTFLAPRTFAAIATQAARQGTRFDCKALTLAGKQQPIAADPEASEQVQALVKQQC